MKDLSAKSLARCVFTFVFAVLLAGHVKTSNNRVRRFSMKWMMAGRMGGALALAGIMGLGTRMAHASGTISFHPTFKVMKSLPIKTLGVALGIFLLAGMARGAQHVSVPGSGEVVDASPSHPSLTAEKAFDGDTSNEGRWLVSQDTIPGYVTWRFTDGNVYEVESYRLNGQHLQPEARSPRHHQLLGSNDGVNWTVVHEEENIPTLANNTWTTFTVDSPGAFEYYRFNVLAWGGEDDWGALRGIELWGEVGSLSSWSPPSVSEITATSAQASAVTEVALDEAKLLWDTTDQGTDDPNDWTVGTLSLGAQAAEATVSGSITGLAADTFYTFRFYGEHGVETEWSMPVTFATALTAAQTPVFTGVETSFNSVMLQWTDNANTESGYVLRRANSPSGPFDVIAELGPNATSYLDAGLLDETTYHYQLAAVNEENGSSTAFEDCVTQATTARIDPNIIVYEGFHYFPASAQADPGGNQDETSDIILTGKPDGTEGEVDAIGLSGTWANAVNDPNNMYLVEGSLTFGDLLISGNHIRYRSNQSSDRLNRLLTAAAANTIANAEEIWFSFLANRLQNNFSNGQEGIAIANNVLNSAMFGGVDASGRHGFGVAATDNGSGWRAWGWDGENAVESTGSFSVPTDGSEVNLLIGHIAFDSGTDGKDVFTLYHYHRDFVDGTITADMDNLVAFASIEVDVDQSQLNTLNVTRQVNTAYDEIRIGRTLNAVLGFVDPPGPPKGTLIIMK